MSTWVLLRGLTRGSGHWGLFARSMQERLDGAAVVALDLPGNGLLNELPSPATIGAMATWCREHLRAMGIETPVYLLAVSMGAMVATEWATRAPQAVAGCVLVNTSFAGISPWHQRLRPSSCAALLSIAFAARTSAQREAAILRLTSRNARAAAAVVEQWTALRDAHPVSAKNALQQLLAAARYRPPLVAPKVPLLVLSSTRDALVDPRCSQALAAHWRCASAIHPRAGHDLTLDDGSWVVARIREWLAT
jgi:pimeloyl-ACP methyl ester carboxylesterase